MSSQTLATRDWVRPGSMIVGFFSPVVVVVEFSSLPSLFLRRLFVSASIVATVILAGPERGGRRASPVATLGGQVVQP